MSLGRRDPHAMHRTAGVDADLWHEFAPGQRVRTVEGVLGTVTEIQDGPHPGNEQYVVALDGGLGGGEYAASELTAVVATLARLGALDEAHVASEDYPELEEILAKRLPPEHALRATAGLIATADVTQRPVWKVLSLDEDSDPEYDRESWWWNSSVKDNGIGTIEASIMWDHFGSRWNWEVDGLSDYNTPPLNEHGHALDAETAKRIIDDLVTKWLRGSGVDMGPDIRPAYHGDLPWHSRPATPRQRYWFEASLQTEAGRWVVVDDGGAIHAGPFENSYQARDALREQTLDPNQSEIGNALHVQREAPGNADFMVDAGLFDKVRDIYTDKTGFEPGRNVSFDWCRFRREQHCWYPKHLNVEASHEAGYAVWIPEDRGYCPRNRWEDQKACPAPSEPGPRSGEPNRETDATIPWEEGGQRVAIRTKVDWHFTASWKDVQSKARGIRAEGHVRIISATQGYVTAEVRGDTNIYQTTIMRAPGKKSIAMWECGCAWGNYSWGRSGRWKKYEGRMCSHALATTYEAQAREMFGKDIAEDRMTPKWRNDPTIPVITPGNSRVKPTPWRVSTLHMEAFNPATEPYLDPLMKKLVDYRPERPLSNPSSAMILSSVLPHVSWVPYSKMPFFDHLHDLMGADPVKDQIDDLVSDREDLFGKVPVTPHKIDVDKLVFTQPTVNAQKVMEMTNGITPGGKAAFLVQYGGRTYVIDGHHRLVAQLLNGIHDINARMLDLDHLIDKAAMRRTALPAINSDPNIEDIVRWYQQSAKQEEPRVSRDVQEIAHAEAGMTAGFSFRIKNPSSVERKLRDKAPSKQKMGLPPTEWVQDSLRYTIIFHPSIYSKAVQDCLYRFQEKGYRILAEENSWQPGDSYSGLHYNLIEPGGLVIEVQFHTAESYMLKQVTLHKLYEEFRDGKTPLRRKQELFDLMTKYWDEVEIPKDVLGKPERGIEGFPQEHHYLRPASLQPHCADTSAELAIAPTAMRVEADIKARVRGLVQRIKALVGIDKVRLDNNEIVPAAEVIHPDWTPHRGIIDFHPIVSSQKVYVPDEDPWALGELWDEEYTPDPNAKHVDYPEGYKDWSDERQQVWLEQNVWNKKSSKRDAPAERYGLRYDPSLVAHPEVQAAKAFTGWKDIPLTQVSPLALYATEGMLSSASIDKVVSGAEPLRSGYDPQIARLSDGRDVIIDGHHRAAMASSQARSLQAHVLDMSTMREASLADGDDEYELLVASRGNALTHIGTGRVLNGLPMALCGTTVAPLDQKWVDYMGAAAQGTCGRCLTILRGRHTASERTMEGSRENSTPTRVKARDWVNNAVRDGRMDKPDHCQGRDCTETEIKAHHEDYRTKDKVKWLCSGCHEKADSKHGTLHDEPEPAIPTTDGADDDDTDVRYLGESRDLLAGIAHTTALQEAGPTTTLAPSDDMRPSWLAAGGNNGRYKAHMAENAKIADVARRFLKEGVKVFSAEEQALIINEDTGERAANLDRLDITGTHYEALERISDDESWMY